MSMSGAATTPISRIIGWNCWAFAAVDWSTSSQPIAGRPFASLMQASDPTAPAGSTPQRRSEIARPAARVVERPPLLGEVEVLDREDAPVAPRVERGGHRVEVHDTRGIVDVELRP